MKHLLKFMAVVWGALLFALAPASSYFTIDVVNQWLCRVNVDTGAVDYVGPATNWGEPQYFNGYQSDTTTHLAYHGGYLYASTSWRIGWPYKLAIVEYQGGGAGGQVGNLFLQLPFGGTSKLGGFDSTGSSLVATWGGAASYGAADQISIIAPNGSFSNTGPLGAPDSEGYGYFGGASWAVDSDMVSLTGFSVYSAPLAPLLAVGGDSGGSLNVLPGDIADYNTNEFVAMGQGGSTVLHIAKVGGFRLSVVPMTGAWPNAIFRGIALAPNKKILQKAFPHG